MAETLGSALSTLFSGRVSTSTRTPVQTTSSLGLSTKALANQALKIYNQAQTGLRQGDFSVFGEKLRQLKGILQDLAR
ncbi:MAG: hypothetical protein HQ596_02215 [Candidatus Saganbacteria bacterium]|nr:hypothetical protein [Candidatus Saganbacteria bacterium]